MAEDPEENLEESPAKNPEENSGPDAEGDDVVETIQQTDTLGFYPLLLISLALGIALPWGIWFLVRDMGPTPVEQAAQATELLEIGRTKTAYLRAMRLLKNRVSDPDIGGSLEYIVGVAHFRKAEKDVKESPIMNRTLAVRTFDLARRYLEQANLKSLSPELRPEWSYSLGACYYYLGRLYEAREYLELAYFQSEQRQPQIMLMLGECYLDPNVMKASLIDPNDPLEEKMKRLDVIKRLESVIDPSLDPQPLSETEALQTLLYIANLNRQEKELDKADAVLKKVNALLVTGNHSEEMRFALTDREELLRAMLAMDRKNTEKTREILQNLITKKSGLQQRATLQAHYIVGLSYQLDKNVDQALDHLEKPALDTNSEVCFAANLYAADLARKRGLHEAALVYYLRALSLVDSTEMFTNRWIDLEKARSIVQAAWDDWGVSERYQHYRFSVELADHMVPLFSSGFANQLSALASRKRAELVQREMERLGSRATEEMKRAVSEHWKRAGHAYSRLASSSLASDKYDETLWEAAILYRHGNDFKNALHMIEKYIATKPRVGLPRAMIMKARTMMDLDSFSEENGLDEAILILEKLIKLYPKDQSIYDAQLLLGQAYLEEDQYEKAIEIWRSLITKSPLTPKATEWQAAMFALGGTLFNTSDTRPSILVNLLEKTADPEEQLDPNHYQHVDEAIYWLKEFVTRIPNHPRSQEARWLLAKGLQYRAGRPIKLIKDAETENTHNELLKEIRSLLGGAMEQFVILEDELAAEDQRDQLDELTIQFMRDAYFEPAHIQYDLGLYDETKEAYRKSIDLYSNAAFHFSGDPIVLIAYFRIAECYRQLGADAEARRQLEQARVILSQLDEPFVDSSTNFNKQQWEQLLSQYVKLYDLALDLQVGQ